MKKLFSILLQTMITALCFAQQSGTPIKVTLAISARSYSDRIVLRYAPANPILFSQANKVGYIVERANFVNGIASDKLSFTPIAGSPFKRWNEEQWEKALVEEKLKDTSAAKIAGLAMVFSDPDGTSQDGDVMKEGLKSFKDQKDNSDMRFGFALIAANRSRVAAEGLAVRVSDASVTPGQTYVYRVRLNQPLVNAANETAYVKVRSENFNEKYLSNNKAVKVSEGDGAIAFSFPESSEYYAFTAERSDNNGASYIKIIKTPELNLKPTGFTGKSDFAYGDTGLTNYKKYYYRILVSTPFADELVLSEFIAIPRDKTPPPAPFLKTAIHIKPKQVELSWEMTAKSTGDLKGFTIKRGTQENGKYSLISKGLLPANTMRFIDETFDPDGSNYYVVEAVDTAGNSSHSYPAYVTLIDSVPPAMPFISSAKIDSVGKIIIKVRPNTEKDFMGYQVLKANSKEHEFSVVTETFKDSLGRTTFTLNDSTTLNTLTKNIYYKVIAFDTHFNQSLPSKIIELTKRDTIPPVSPLITGFTVSDTSVVIIFVNSSSEDAARNILLRRESGKVKFDSIFFNTNTSVIKFTDKKITGGRQYEYAMIARDDGGLASKISRSIQIKTLLNNRIPAPTIQGSYDGQAKKVSLSFVVDEKVKNRQLKVEIYKRADEKSLWTTYKIIEFEKGKLFFDDPAAGQKGMMYTIRLTDANKNVSNFSNELQLNY
ncbi:fibronectin type III domain-containing protein [Daejeonella sp.]|uniref:fibronectin type III domain-containing protein n=1 Tax=Daejeonella sp. TaxID=2805397 RepID=UPI003983B0D9